jgi:hypothetical protein
MPIAMERRAVETAAVHPLCASLPNIVVAGICSFFPKIKPV